MAFRVYSTRFSFLEIMMTCLPTNTHWSGYLARFARVSLCRNDHS
jgi:hypothetical protein